MATTKKRINISLSSELEKTIEKLALRDEMPEATKASDLLHLAVEIEEDAVWNEIAKKRDTKGARFVSHKKSWDQ
jgi:hypothetical protein